MDLFGVMLSKKERFLTMEEVIDFLKIRFPDQNRSGEIEDRYVEAYSVMKRAAEMCPNKIRKIWEWEKHVENHFIIK